LDEEILDEEEEDYVEGGEEVEEEEEEEDELEVDLYHPQAPVEEEQLGEGETSADGGDLDVLDAGAGSAGSHPPASLQVSDSDASSVVPQLSPKAPGAEASPVSQGVGDADMEDVLPAVEADVAPVLLDMAEEQRVTGQQIENSAASRPHEGSSLVDEDVMMMELGTVGYKVHK